MGQRLVISIYKTKKGKQSTVAMEDLLEDFDGVFRRLTVDTSVIDKYFKGEF